MQVAARLAALALAAAAHGDVLSLPTADARNGNDLGYVWSGFVSPPQPLMPWGDALANVPGCVVVAGSQGYGPPGAVWIWRIPDERDPMARYGPAPVQTLRPIGKSGGPSEPTDFGASVAGGELWLFVGAPTTAVSGVANAGAVHVFRRTSVGAPWTEFGILPNPDPALSQLYGVSLAFDGATLVVGVPTRKAHPLAATTGGADVYDVSESAIGEPRSFTAPLVGGFYGNVGQRVAVSGTRFAASDPNAAVIGGSGVVFVVTTGDLDIETVLSTPSAQAGTQFGASISMQGDRLAVGAPKEDVGGVANVGVARIYTHDGEHWLISHTLSGSTPGAQLGEVALDGDLMAVGAWLTAVEVGEYTEPGTCSLYRVEPLKLVPLAHAVPTVTDASSIRYLMGQRVALGHGRWSYTETIATGPSFSDSVRTLPVGAAESDCDQDGESDLDEVLAGASDLDADGIPDECVTPPSVDCDDDGLADSSTTMFAPTIGGYSGLDAIWWGSQNGSSEDRALMWLVPRTVPTGTDGVLHGVEADWVSAYDERGQPVIVAVYDDPNQDGDPSDVVLRGAYLGAVSPTAGKDRILFPPIPIGPAGTRYFVGVGAISLKYVQSTLYLRAEETDPTVPPRSWVTYGHQLLASDFNVEEPQSNETFELFAAAPDMVCAGLFRAPIDANGNGVPDLCECTADLDGDGDVDAGDLSTLIGSWGTSGLGDLDGDNAVGPADLALLLGMWGTCVDGP